MNASAVFDKLNHCLETVKTIDIVKEYPKLKEAIDYIIFQFDEDYHALSTREAFENGTKLNSIIIEFFSVLVSKYYTFVYGKDLQIINENTTEYPTAGGIFNADDDKIYYSNMGIVLSSPGRGDNLGFLYTFLHEACHKRQCDSYKTDDMDSLMEFPPYMILLAKEFVVLEDLKKRDPVYHKAFYDENYKKLYVEQEAYYSACKMLPRMLSQLYDEYKLYTLRTNNKDNEVSRNEQDKTTDAMRKFAETVMYSYKGQGIMKGEILEEFLMGMPIVSTFTYDNMPVDRLILIDKTIKAHPEIQMKYPIFKFIFNEFIPKTYEEIIEDRDRLINQYPRHSMNIHNMYRVIINSDPVLFLEEIVVREDIRALHVFLTNHPQVLTEYQSDIERISSKCKNNRILEILNSGVRMGF